MGGTGKTPVCDYLARELIDRKPVLVLRGYRRQEKTALPLLVSDGQNRLASAAEAGDEAFWLARRKGATVIVDSKRSRAIETHTGPGSLIILDDAFQNPSVYADFQLVLLDASLEPAAFRTFPAGRFREGAAALGRADAVLLTRTDQAPPHFLQYWDSLATAAALPVFRARQTLRLPSIPDDARVGAFCGLGHPEAFFRLIEDSGQSLVRRLTFPDHHPYRAREIAEFLSAADLWLTTEKDAVRLPELVGRERIFVASMEISLDRPVEFLQTVLSGPRPGRELQ